MEENYEQIFEELINKYPTDTLYAMFHYIYYYPNGYEIWHVGNERAGLDKKGTYLFKRNSENKKILLKFLPEEENNNLNKKRIMNNTNKWIYIESNTPYTAIASVGITLETSFLLNVPKLNWNNIKEYEYLTQDEDNSELDAIIINSVGAIIRKKALEHNKEKIYTLLNN